jgi:putative transposase
VKYAFMARHRRVWPVRWMSQALGVSTSGFYEWLTRPESNRSMTNRTILVRIRESFDASHQTYGSPRVWRDLRDWNVPCGENRTARLMRQAGLVARVRLKTPRYVAGRRSMIAPNVLDRQFHADAPNQKWVADFTYIPTREGWLYLAVVLDLYSRMVVGWSHGAARARSASPESRCRWKCIHARRHRACRPDIQRSQGLGCLRPVPGEFRVRSSSFPQCRSGLVRF